MIIFCITLANDKILLGKKRQVYVLLGTCARIPDKFLSLKISPKAVFCCLMYNLIRLHVASIQSVILSPLFFPLFWLRLDTQESAFVTELGNEAFFSWILLEKLLSGICYFWSRTYFLKVLADKNMNTQLRYFKSEKWQVLYFTANITFYAGELVCKCALYTAHRSPSSV